MILYTIMYLYSCHYCRSCSSILEILHLHKKIYTRHTPSVKYLMTLIDIDVLFLSHWYYFFIVSTTCVKTILRERLLLSLSPTVYWTDHYLQKTTNTEIRFIAWVKVKIACHDRKYATSRDEIKYVLFICSHIVYAKISKHREALYNFLWIFLLWR